MTRDDVIRAADQALKMLIRDGVVGPRALVSLRFEPGEVLITVAPDGGSRAKAEDFVLRELEPVLPLGVEVGCDMVDDPPSPTAQCPIRQVPVDVYAAIPRVDVKSWWQTRPEPGNVHVLSAELPSLDSDYRAAAELALVDDMASMVAGLTQPAKPEHDTCPECGAEAEIHWHDGQCNARCPKLHRGGPVMPTEALAWRYWDS